MRKLAATAFLFVLAAWPLLVCHVPPLEDLPAHLATAVVIRHPEAYPDLVFQGFFKTNSALFLFLRAFGEGHLVLASKLFVALVLLAHAWVLPRLVVGLGGPERLVAGTLLAAPLVHNWFVAMGMLDYALGSALALGCLLLVVRQVRAPTVARAVGLGALALLVWYCHALALGFAVLLVVLAALRDRAVIRAASPMGAAVVLAGVAAAMSLSRPHAPVGLAASYRPPWEMLYELWAKYAWSFTRAELASLVTTAVLVIACVRARKLEVPLLSMTAAGVLLAFYFLVPHELLAWGNVPLRALPFLYAIALVRAPADPSPVLRVALGASALAWSVGLGVGYMRLARDYADVEAGIPAVPEGADLLPLVFAPRGSSDNTWALEEAWGLYVVGKHTSAPLVFAHLPGHPLAHRGTPPEDPLRIGRELAEASSSADARADLERVAKRHAWLLEIGRPPTAFEQPPSDVAFTQGDVTVLHVR